MYFRTFQEAPTLNLSSEAILTVEYLTTQILVNADPEYLREVIEQGKVVDAIYRELSFLGHIRKAILPHVQEYLTSHAYSLTNIATQLMKEPQNKTLRDELLTPLKEHAG
jgi:hypothetical protein